MINKKDLNLYNILFFPTRYFPAISGAEFYLQRMAEILTIKYNYNIDIYTSNAVDFKALRDPQGKIITNNEKDYNTVNNLKIHRFSVNYDLPLEEKIIFIKNLEDFIIYLDEIGADFINLNEFEYCFPNSKCLKDRGFNLREGTIASVKESYEMAIDLITRISNKVSMKIHFCTIRAKDTFQLTNRYLRRAKKIKLPYEEITEEGLLLYGQIEGKKTLLEKLYHLLISDLKIPKKFISLEENTIKLPYYIAIEDEIIRFLDEYDLNGYILEVLPFRRIKYRQITEITPVKVFKEEVVIDENR